MFDLARHYPGWRFTAVDPSAPMLEICSRKAQEQGIAPRCFFHADYLSSLSTPDRFDAATCFLVSHFLTDRDERQALFTESGIQNLPLNCRCAKYFLLT
jgi:tRNA (cmo5U34)-methyltransferase